VKGSDRTAHAPASVVGASMKIEYFQARNTQNPNYVEWGAKSPLRMFENSSQKKESLFTYTYLVG
jgi:hypothetical protein